MLFSKDRPRFNIFSSINNIWLWVNLLFYLFLICLSCYLAGFFTTRGEAGHFGHFQAALWAMRVQRKFNNICDTTLPIELHRVSNCEI